MRSQLQYDRYHHSLRENVLLIQEQCVGGKLRRVILVIILTLAFFFQGWIIWISYSVEFLSKYFLIHQVESPDPSRTSTIRACNNISVK